MISYHQDSYIKREKSFSAEVTGKSSDGKNWFWHNGHWRMIKVHRKMEEEKKIFQVKRNSKSNVKDMRLFKIWKDP